MEGADCERLWKARHQRKHCRLSAAGHQDGDATPSTSATEEMRAACSRHGNALAVDHTRAVTAGALHPPTMPGRLPRLWHLPEERSWSPRSQLKEEQPRSVVGWLASHSLCPSSALPAQGDNVGSLPPSLIPYSYLYGTRGAHAIHGLLDGGHAIHGNAEGVIPSRPFAEQHCPGRRDCVRLVSATVPKWGGDNVRRCRRCRRLHGDLVCAPASVGSRPYTLLAAATVSGLCRLPSQNGEPTMSAGIVNAAAITALTGLLSARSCPCVMVDAAVSIETLCTC